MQVTRRFWTVALVGLAFSIGAVVFARPVLLWGTVGLAAWLVAAQVRFVRALSILDDQLIIDLTVTRPRVATDEQTQVTVDVTVGNGSPLAITCRAEPPIGTEGATRQQRTLMMSPGEAEARTVLSIEAPVAGTYTFDQTQVLAEDATGLFTETIARGPTPTVTVEPRAPRNVHVGEGGEEVAAAFGEHATGQLGTGIEPAEIREYTAGDEAHRIDWKATARLNHPYIREFETESDRVSALVMDHRSSLHIGRPGETKLDYLRQTALAFVNSARTLNDPIGLYLVGDQGMTGEWAPAAGHSQYTRLRDQLYALQAEGAGGDVDASQRYRIRQAAERTPAGARTAADRLATDTSAFGRTLAPYFAEADPYVARITSDPLFGTAERRLSRLHGRIWTVIFTDDTHRSELRETVKLARQGDDNVLVFLTPSVLFEVDGLADLDDAYGEYRDFEEFRQSLARLPRVTALEVGPGDRLSAVLQAGRRHRDDQASQQEVDTDV